MACRSPVGPRRPSRPGSGFDGNRIDGGFAAFKSEIQANDFIAGVEEVVGGEANGDDFVQVVAVGVEHSAIVFEAAVGLDEVGLGGSQEARSRGIYGGFEIALHGGWQVFAVFRRRWSRGGFGGDRPG